MHSLSWAFESREQLLRLAALDPWLPQQCHHCKTSDSENYTTPIHEQPVLSVSVCDMFQGPEALLLLGAGGGQGQGRLCSRFLLGSLETLHTVLGLMNWGIWLEGLSV